MSTPRPTKTRIVSAFMAVFLLGGVTGAAVGYVVQANRSIDLFDEARRGSRHGVFLWSLERKLNLSSKQKRDIEDVLARYDAETAKVMAPVDPRTRALRAKMRGDVRALLEPGQQKSFDELIAAWDAARHRPDQAADAPATSSAPASSGEAPGAAPSTR